MGRKRGKRRIEHGSAAGGRIQRIDTDYELVVSYGWGEKWERLEKCERLEGGKGGTRLEYHNSVFDAGVYFVNFTTGFGLRAFTLGYYCYDPFGVG